jgi:hypothetical protein
VDAYADVLGIERCDDRLPVNTDLFQNQQWKKAFSGRRRGS